ncbi:MAG TPA: 5'-methylthioadenosine/S-adenosylhomocysteine nucleosidase [Thermomicrobiaceae bacterium]|nr:5'-methylthioadenosine/S-adenosylhomocysteine nucleosidase [Thermomicrobiaceae bacterium]
MDPVSPYDELSGNVVALSVAMPSEARHVLADLDRARPIAVGPWRGWCGVVSERPVVLLLTGIGMVNAAAGLAALLSRWRPRAILNVGCAGAHRVDVMPGDVIAATATVAHGSIAVLPDGSEHFIGHNFDVEGATLTPHRLDADSQLLALARRATVGWSPEPWPESTMREPAVHFGIVASADCFTQHTARIEALHARHGSLCEDMEAAALAQVAAIHRIPFLAIKDVSNNEFLNTTVHGPHGPNLVSVRDELGRRAWDLTRRTIGGLEVER